MQYYMDFSQFSLDKLIFRIQNRLLIPSHQILSEDIIHRFQIMKQTGIINLEQLDSRLNNKKKISQYAIETGIPEKYLEILIRHIGIYRPKPNLLRDFPEVNQDAVKELAIKEIKNTRQFLEQANTPEKRLALATSCNLSETDLMELACLSDLSRAGYVGPIFARLLYEAGAISIRELSGCQADVLFQETLEVNRNKSYYKGSFQIKDVAWCIDIAGELPIVLE